MKVEAVIKAKRKKIHIYQWVILVSIILSLILILIWPRWIVDDAYIYFRYAENLAKHGELTWNVGGEKVEGYTGILWVLLLAAGIKFGIKPEIFFVILNILFFYSGLYVIYHASRSLQFSNILKIIFPFLYVLTAALYTHLFSGLETMLFIFLSLLSTYYYYLLVKNDEGLANKIGFSLSNLLLSLTRPEGIAFALLLFLAQLTKSKAKKRNFLIIGLIYLLPFSLYFLWKLFYYGSILPNTFFAKSNQPYLLAGNINYFIRFFAKFLFVPLALLFACFCYGRNKALERLKESPWEIMQLAVPIVATLPSILVYLTSFLDMNYSFRFAIHFYLVYLLSLFVVLNELACTTRNLRKPTPVCMIITIIVILLGIRFLIGVWNDFGEEIQMCKIYKDLVEYSHKAIGKELAKMVKEGKLPQTSTVALRDAGAISYYSKLNIIDFGLLNDKHLAKVGLEGTEAVEYFFQKMPEVAIIPSYSTNTISNNYKWLEDFYLKIICDERFFMNYDLYKIYAPQGFAKANGVTYSEHVYLRKY